MSASKSTSGLSLNSIQELQRSGPVFDALYSKGTYEKRHENRRIDRR